MAEFLTTAVRGGWNIVIAGAYWAGKDQPRLLKT